MRTLPLVVVANLLLMPLGLLFVSLPSSGEYAEQCVAIMRPTADLYETYNWDTYPETPTSEWDKVDDPIRDDDATYVYTWGNAPNWVAQQFNMSDVAIINQTIYIIETWAIAKRLGTSTVPHIHLALYPQYPTPTTEVTPGFPLTTSWTNYSYRFWYTPHSDAIERARFDAHYLNNTRLFLWGYNCSYPVAGILVSQVGIAVYQVIEAEYVGPVPRRGGEWGISLVGVFGFAGLMGMIMIPTAAVYMYRRGDHDMGSGVRTAVTLIAAFMLCLTMFMFSIMGA